MATVAQIETDPVIQALASSGMLIPKNKKDFGAYASGVANCTLGVTVRLLPEEAARRDLPQDTVIGVINLGWGGFNGNTAHHRNSNIGIAVTHPHRNKGYGREALDWMLDWAFLHAGLHTVSISVASFNPSAIHLYKSIGFVQEGCRREIIWFNGGWHDELELGMTEAEWKKLRNRH